MTAPFASRSAVLRARIAAALAFPLTAKNMRFLTVHVGRLAAAEGLIGDTAPAGQVWWVRGDLRGDRIELLVQHRPIESLPDEEPLTHRQVAEDLAALHPRPCGVVVVHLGPGKTFGGTVCLVDEEDAPRGEN